MISEIMSPSDMRKMKVTLHPPKDARGYYTLVSNYELLNCIINHAIDMNWQVGTLFVGLSKDEAEMSAGIELLIPDVSVPEGFNLCFGVRNTENRRRKLEFYGGIVCKRTGVGIPLRTRYTRGRKHSLNLDIYYEVMSALDTFNMQADTFDDQLAKLQERTLSDSEIMWYLREAGRREIMPWSRIGRIDKLIQENGYKQAYHLLLAFCIVSGMNPPIVQLDQKDKFRNLLGEPTL